MRSPQLRIRSVCATRAKVQRRLKRDTWARCHLYTEGPQVEEEKLAKDTSTTARSRRKTAKKKKIATNKQHTEAAALGTL